MGNIRTIRIYQGSYILNNNAKIIDAGNKYGNMNTNAKFFEEGMSAEERRRKFLESRMMLSQANKHQIDPYKFYMSNQTKKHDSVTLTEEMIESHLDGWDLEIDADILMVTEKTPGVVVGYPVADCPVLIATDLKNGVTATAHCSAEMIDNYLPQATIEELKRKYDSKDEDLAIYIGAHAGNNWTYDTMPRWATESFWEETGAIKEVNGIYRIDLDKALLHKLNPEKFLFFAISADDTITNPRYYSNSAASKGEKVKAGRHFQGAYYKRK